MFLFDFFSHALRRKKVLVAIVTKYAIELFHVQNFTYLVIDWFELAVIDVISAVDAKICVV